MSGNVKDVKLLDVARVAVARGISSLERCLKTVDERLRAADEYDAKLASHLAYLTEHTTRVLAELRKLEKHEKDAVAAMTRDEKDRLVRAYIAALPKARRDEFIALLEESP